jgi:enamine deaminase RidA (YjgF/YER057c/UK114 family)
VPPPPPPVANYVGVVRVGTIAFVSGHGPYDGNDYVYRGKLSRDLDVAAGQEAARLTILNLLGTLKHELGELDRVARIVKLLVLVNSDPGFADQPLVADGASNLLVEAFGEDRGQHARSAVGMAALPFGISVEIEGIVEVSE